MLADKVVHWIEFGRISYLETMKVMAHLYIVAPGILFILSFIILLPFGGIQSYPGRDFGGTVVQELGTGNLDLPSVLVLGVYFFVAALTEEYLFRFLPVGLAAIILWRRFPKAVLLISIAASFIFGYIHAPNYLIVMGSTGFILCVLFLKIWRSQKSFALALASSTALHFSWNMMIIVVNVIFVALGLL
ncbi:hypothetical protein A2801_01530 [Candidatus Woesebacteria bacterium RIFCSPHIGHO2_01_FULL_41_10]|uniref:CAAX prenyl protease 2/Lysostaphin resistance protein A-like domain-containing protein n=1 Tax=Candidatus Woesebacteria bacterium RIFCSPHIGHO2_01_FULL_41_10 TaxID=1802500 RepID=A0A1F7YPT1_9BACT|nr:MAG: hypothetical protein A2801_01530 [Candidatus Woesebacteria bacterium RIFCSPHIGHO2_01_FULL_41_10]